jgi:hypothetical protein
MYDESLNRKSGKLDTLAHWRSRAFTLSKPRPVQISDSIQSANQYVNIGLVLMLKRTVCRFSSSMMANIVARAPLVAVVGATGTGKSEVSLDNYFGGILLPKKSHQKSTRSPLLILLPNSWL